MKINAIIKEYRLKIGLTQAQAAQKAGITERMFQYYEAGTQIPGVYNAQRLARALNTTVETLFPLPSDGSESTQEQDNTNDGACPP